MELTEKQVQEIKKELGDAQFEKIMNPKAVFDPSKIYLAKGLKERCYKLHKVVFKDLFCWVDLNGSSCHANGRFTTAEKALKSKPDYKEFDSIKDAINSGYFD